MTDRTTNTLLTVIAIGLWANIASQWMQPVTVHAQDDTRIVSELRNIQSNLSNIESNLSSIESDISGLMAGLCLNSKLC